jgi:uncharacterized repeat protein (TIGR03803 family)
MKFAQQMFIPSIALAVVISLGGGATQPAQAQTFTLLHTFTGAPDGANPIAGLVRDAAGNIYGTTQQGGITGGLCANGGLNGCGTVFKLDPSGNETVLYRFTGGADGQFPSAGLVMDAAGNLYGTTQYGGPVTAACGIGCGTVFKLDPTGTTLTTMHNIGSSGGLVMDGAGNLYGSTTEGIFKLDPATGLFAVLDSNAGSGATLALDPAGNLYGTTEFGGLSSSVCLHNSCGTVFELDTTRTYTTLYSFTAVGDDGYNPVAGVALDPAGNLYGTTPYGGAPNCTAGNRSSVGCGIVFKLSPAGAETIFNLNGGDHPVAGLVLDAAGNLYGTTEARGPTADSLGTVFKMTPGGVETVLYIFTGVPDGYDPVAGLVLDASGNLYGTAEFGGVSGMGTVFKINPAGSQNFPLTVALFGNGTVTGNGVDCSSTCSAFFLPGTMVALTAAPPAGSSLVGWSGACSGAGTCSLTINSAQSVGATFDSDFTVSATALTPAAVSAGGSATSTINVAADANGFFSSVALTCSVTPTPALAPTCSINPNSAMPGTPATLMVRTTAATAAVMFPSAGPELFYALCLPLIGMVGAGVGLGSKQKGIKRKLAVAALPCLLSAGLIFQVACGASSSTGGGGGGNKGTPTGTYTITVTGTYSTGSLVHTTPTMLTVQ